VIPLTKPEQAHFLSVLRATRGRFQDAVKKSGLDEVAVSAARTTEDPQFDRDFSVEVARLERLRVNDLDELIAARAEKGSTSAAESVFRRRAIEDKQRNRKPPEPKPVKAPRKPKPEPEKVDVAQLGEARTAHLLANREEPS